MSRSPVVEFVDVFKDYPTGLLGRRRIRAVAGVSLRLDEGQVVGLVGPNRAGKTTLLKMLLSLCRPTTGAVFRFGQPASDRRSLARVGYVHENQALPRYLSATGLLQSYGALTLLPYEVVRRRVPLLLARVGLADRANEPISSFSKGMIQRLGVAQALLNEPDLLVMDEPTEGLDVDGRRMVREVILEQRRRGRTVVLVSHLLTEVQRVCDRIVVLERGRLVHTGPTRTLLHDPGSESPRPLENALNELCEVTAS